MVFAGTDEIDAALEQLSATLEARGIAPCELVVVGGAAFNLAGILIRPTRDVDVLAIRESVPGADTRLVKCAPLPEPISSAAASVAQTLRLDPDWLNCGPAALLDHGMPDGFAERLTPKEFGSHLRVYTPARTDLIAMKVFAAADTGVGRHTQDLDVLAPTQEELMAGARWAATHDPSVEFASQLIALLRYYGVDANREVLADEN